eukprot:1441073-Amphidinium_carterae.1
MTTSSTIAWNSLPLRDSELRDPTNPRFFGPRALSAVTCASTHQTLASPTSQNAEGGASQNGAMSAAVHFV